MSDLAPEPTWKLVAHLRCYGDLKTQEVVNPEGGDPLQGAEAIEVSYFKWEEEEASFQGVTQAMAATIAEALAEKLKEQQKDLSDATAALESLRALQAD